MPRSAPVYFCLCCRLVAETIKNFKLRLLRPDQLFFFLRPGGVNISITEKFKSSLYVFFRRVCVIKRALLTEAHLLIFFMGIGCFQAWGEEPEV